MSDGDRNILILCKQLTYVRQSGALSLCLFATFIDGFAKRASATGRGCQFGLTCPSIILYADDIILLAHSVTSLQSLLNVCEDKLYYLDLFMNSSKFKFIRFGTRYGNMCVSTLEPWILKVSNGSGHVVILKYYLFMDQT